MDILENKKVLAGIVAGVVVVMGLLFFVFGNSEGGDEGAYVDDSAVSPAVTDPTMAGGVPTDATGAVASAAGAKAGKAEPPMVPGKADPFKPLVKPPGTMTPQERYLAQANQELSQIQPLTIYNTRPTAISDTGTLTGGANPNDPNAMTQDTGPDTTQRRMAGLVVGKNTYAILEVEGQTAVVKPGDILPDLSRVERIERDRILLRKGNRAISVPLSANPNAVVGGGGGPTGPGGGYGGYPTGPRGAGSAPPPGTPGGRGFRPGG
jgi:hypothetical protein